MRRIMIAAVSSGSGKTSVTCSLLQAVKNRGLRPVAFKCGPDYIDPMFHTHVLGVPSRNLDLFFAAEDHIRGTIASHGAEGDFVVMEGVMGYYDGVAGGEEASSWHLARATGTPVILVLDPKGMSLSAAALVKGFLDFRRPNQIAGLILNKCSESLCAHLKPILERETGLPVLGCLPLLEDCSVESRHLGLVTAPEVADLREKIARLGAALEQTVDLDRLLAIAGVAPPLVQSLPEIQPATDAKPVIAVARDRAYCFYYEENLELLRHFGAVIAPFSPLTDTALPEGASALYLGGGYPELYGRQLAENVPMRRAVREAAGRGMPILAECGGFQYLQAFLEDCGGVRHPMAGLIASESRPAGKLVRFGYVELTARKDTLLCDAGETIRGHEFHHWDSSVSGDAFTARKPASSRSWPCIVAEGSLFAGYPHLSFASNPGFPRRFVEAAAKFRMNHTVDGRSIIL